MSIWTQWTHYFTGRKGGLKNFILLPLLFLKRNMLFSKNALSLQNFLVLLSSEDRMTKRIDEAKEELRAELATKEQVANLGIAIHQVDTNLVKKVNKHERRLENLEEKKQTNDPHKTNDEKSRTTTSEEKYPHSSKAA